MVCVVGNPDGEDWSESKSTFDTRGESVFANMLVVFTARADNHRAGLYPLHQHPLPRSITKHSRTHLPATCVVLSDAREVCVCPVCVYEYTRIVSP